MWGRGAGLICTVMEAHGLLSIEVLSSTTFGFSAPKKIYTAIRSGPFDRFSRKYLCFRICAKIVVFTKAFMKICVRQEQMREAVRKISRLLKNLFLFEKTERIWWFLRKCKYLFTCKNEISSKYTKMIKAFFVQTWLYFSMLFEVGNRKQLFVFFPLLT